MPTASRLAAAIAFAILGFLAAHLYASHLPPESVVGRLREVSALVGAVVGWWTLGREIGKQHTGERKSRGYGNAFGAGVRTAVVMVFWVLLGFSIYLMVRKSMHMMYDGPMEAVLGIFDLMLEYGRKLAEADVLATLFVGGGLGGVLTEWAGRRWP